MITTALPVFEDAALDARLDAMTRADIDLLDFGVIGFDPSTVVRIYNAFESKAAGLRPETVVGQRLFDVVAPCMNNDMVAERFVQAAASATPLDVVINYVLTLRMRPTRVLLRLVADPGSPLRYVLIQRRA